MTVIELVLVALGFVMAVGAGISVGWVLHANYVKAHPSGIEAVAKMAAAQLTALEANSRAQVERVETAYLAANQTLQNALTNLSFATRPGVADGPAPPAPAMSMADSVARATGDPTTDRTAMRDMLIRDRGLPADVADAILDHKLDDIPPGALLGELVDRVLAEQTGIQ